jgi:hypothetical protein
MEAKIEAKEGDQQTERYFDAAESFRVERCGVGTQALEWFGFLTLEGEPPKPGSGYPYTAKLSQSMDPSQLQTFLDRRGRFTKALDQEVQNEGLLATRQSVKTWERPTTNNLNQVTALKERFLTSRSVGEFNEWLGTGLSTMSVAVDRAVLAAKLGV